MTDDVQGMPGAPGSAAPAGLAGAPETAAPAVGYPVEWEADAILRDGTTTHIRPIRPQDADALQAFHEAQSERSTYLRFFAALPSLPARDLERFTHVDLVDRVALVAVAASHDPQDPGERIVGVARYDRIDTDVAEVAFNIADSIQGRGLASVLLEHIAAAARERGVRRFTAEVLPQNTRMLGVFREAGYDVAQRVEDGIVTVTIDLDPTERSRSVMAERERRAEARSVAGLLDVSSVVVVAGLDPDPRGPVLTGAHGRMISLVIDSLISDDAMPRGAHAAPPQRARVDVVGVPPAERRWPTDRVTYHDVIADVRADGRADGQGGGVAVQPGGQDQQEGKQDGQDERPRAELAVIALPAERVLEAVTALAPLGTRGVVLLSEGYAEKGPDGLALQRELLRVAHTAGMRIVGPGSYGVLRTSGSVRIDALIASRPPAPGRIGLFCQSAPTAVTLLATAARRGLGLSSFLSAGNRADVSGNDLMQFWQDDADTDVVCLYLESIGNPRKFSRIARRLAMHKPVVVATAGRSGHVVPPGHAVRVTRAPQRTLEEMLRQSGVIRAENTHQMMDIAQLLETQPLPAGRRVGIIASSPALATVVAEACGAAELTVAGHVGTIDADTDADAAAQVAGAVFEAPDIDAVVAVDVPVLGEPVATFAQAVAQAAARTGRPAVASLLGRHGIVDELRASAPHGRTVHVPAYATPADAVQALGAVVRYSAWRAQGQGTYVRPDVDVARAHELVERWTQDAGPHESVELDDARTAELLACYGIERVPSITVTTADDAVAAADTCGWPVALKSTSLALRHRTDLGGVQLGIADADDMRVAFDRMQHNIREHLGLEPDVASPLAVQTMVPAGVACVVRTVEDALYGPVVSFGLAGDATDLLGDVSYGIPPLTDKDVESMVRRVRAAPRLFGYHGLAPMDVPALEDLLARVSRLADDVPALQRLELYPVVVSARGARALGVRATLGPARRADESRRAMPV